mgnify:FL=1
MFKVFWVSNENESGERMEVRTIETSQAEAIEVEMDAERDHETDIGQIAVDILDLSDAIVIVAPVAGVDPSEVDIGLSRNILTISGNRRENPIYMEARRMLVEECFYGAFSRSIILPENLAFDKISASVEHNVITILIPKLTLISKSIKIDATKN